MRDCRTHKKNLVMGWIDYRKAYDMVPHSWIEEVIGMMGIADNIKKFMLDSMQRWKTRLEYEGKQLGELRIKRGIFQGDSLSPLMFVMAMIPTDLRPEENKTNIHTQKQEQTQSPVVYG